MIWPVWQQSEMGYGPVMLSADFMTLRLATGHENGACRAGACPGLADASAGPTICAAVIFMATEHLGSL